MPKAVFSMLDRVPQLAHVIEEMREQPRFAKRINDYLPSA